MQFPTLKTARLTLRPFRLADAPRLQQLAGAREVALNTLLVPHPYPDGAAEEWIASHTVKLEEGTINLAIDDGELCGAIGLIVDRDHDRAEIGYWIGVPYWRRGYASEAVGEILRYGFESLGLNRIYAAHFTQNPASGVVMRKNGMRFEGTLRQNYKKWGEYLDSEMYSILRSEFTKERP